MAACLMLSGVGKVRLAGPEIHHVHAFAREACSASAATFMVEDTLMKEMRSAIALTAACMFAY